MPKCPICGDTVADVEQHLQRSILVGRGSKTYPCPYVSNAGTECRLPAGHELPHLPRTGQDVYGILEWFYPPKPPYIAKAFTMERE